jgi:membrane protein DedA with SNARE-associated domain
MNPEVGTDVGSAVAAGLPALFGVVLLGSVILVIPTGAAVSAAAVVAWRHAGPLSVLGVVLAGALGAYVGDLVVYAVCRSGGEQLATRLRWLQTGRLSTSLGRITEQLFRHDVQTLVLGRLLPAGRMPVLVAAGIGRYSWLRFALTDSVAVVVWSVVYTVIGVAGGSLFPETWESVLAAIALVIVFSTLARRITHPALRTPPGDRVPVPDQPAGPPAPISPTGPDAPGTSTPGLPRE